MSQCYEFNYTSNQPQLLPDVWLPCPSGENCCIGTDLCLSNNICHHIRSSLRDVKREASYSGYYNARCTDPTYTSPACDKICIGWPPDIVYNYTSNLWACCGNNTAGQVTCSNPLDQYYEAPAPDDLATLSSGATWADSETLTPYTSTASVAVTNNSSTTLDPGGPIRTANTTSTIPSMSISPPTSSSSSSSPAPQSHSLDTSAKAGIGVGVSIAGIVFILAALFFYARRRRRQRPTQTRTNSRIYPLGVGVAATSVDNRAINETEKERSEMPGMRHQQEAELDSKVHVPPGELT